MMKIVHISNTTSELTVPKKKRLSQKQIIHEAAVNSLAIDRANDKIKAREKFSAEIKKLADLESKLQKLIKDNNLQYYKFKTP